MRQPVFAVLAAVVPNSLVLLRAQVPSLMEATYPLPEGSVPNFVAALDANGDGELDVVTSNWASGSVSVLTNQGHGVLLHSGTFSAGAYPRWIDFGDFDGDLAPDLAVACAQSVVILRGDAQGKFTATGVFAVAGAPRSVHIGDVNLDGNDDIVAFVVLGSGTDGYLDVRLGNGDATFGVSSYCGVTGGYNPVAGVLADATGDGLLDFAVAFHFTNYANGQLKVGDGSLGGFACPSSTTGATFTVEGSNPIAAAAADLNGDGNADISVLGQPCCSPYGTVDTLLGTAGASVANPAGFQIVDGDVQDSIATGDLDTDGDSDVVVSSATSTGVSVLFNDGSGMLGIPTHYATSSIPPAVTVADVTGDGRPDVVTANPSTNSVSVLVNKPAPAALTGHVLFEDGATPVPGPQVRAWVSIFPHGSSGGVAVASSEVKADGSFALSVGTLAPGSYDALAIAQIPDNFWHAEAGQSVAAYQPLDVSLGADFTITASGLLPPTLEFRFRWPAILLHGVNPYDCVPFWPHTIGPAQLTALQSFLAGSATEQLGAPKRCVIPLVPDMTLGGAKNYTQFHAVLKPQIDAIRQAFNPGTRFQVLGYSQGGLVSRLVLDDPAGVAWITKVIHAGTPNLGSCAATVACGLLPHTCVAGWACPLTSDEVASFNSIHGDGHGVPHYLLAGTGFHSLPNLPFANDCLAGTSSDSVVAVSSVTGLVFLNYSVTKVREVNADHFGLTTDLAALRLLRAWLTE